MATAEPGAVAFAGVVLAGGRSTRMGRDKAALAWQGRTLLEHMGGLLRLAGAARVLNCGPRPGPGGLPDRVAGLGPLGGLLSLAETQADGIYLLVPVDMPRLTPALLRSLLPAVAAHAAPSAIWAGHPLPLCLRLDATTRALVADLAVQAPAARSLRRLHAALGGREYPPAAADLACLVNCNTPEEWREVAT